MTDREQRVHELVLTLGDAQNLVDSLKRKLFDAKRDRSATVVVYTQVQEEERDR